MCRAKVLEGYLVLMHSATPMISLINEGLRPEGMDIDKFLFSYSDALKAVSESVRSHPNYDPSFA